MKAKFFDLAKAISLKSTHNAHYMGCVIVQKNRVVSIGFNQLKTHSKSLNPFKFLHAETHAVLGTSLNELKGATCYVYREHKNGSPAMARPCQFCMKTLHLAGIKKICYSTDGGFNEEIL